MQRDGLFVDLAMTHSGETEASESKIVRLYNVHLESLAFEPPLRPKQVRIVDKNLHQDGISAGLMAGENGLENVYLSLDPGSGGGVEDAEEGNAWGYQASAISGTIIRRGGWTRCFGVGVYDP